MDKFASKVTKAVGSNLCFFLSLIAIAIWGISGPLFGFSDTWQLLINTSTTIITFLLVILLQRSSNREMLAINAKLDELISASNANNRMICIEDLTEAELLKLHDELRLRSNYHSSSTQPPQN